MNTLGKIMFLSIVTILLGGCTLFEKEKPKVEQKKELSVQEEVGPRTYEMTLTKLNEKPLLGQGLVSKGVLVPESLKLTVGDTLVVKNRDFDTEQIRIIQVKKDYKESKFKDIVKKDIAKGESLEYTFTDEGAYKVKCLFKGCASTIGVEKK